MNEGAETGALRPPLLMSAEDYARLVALTCLQIPGPAEVGKFSVRL
jgi:hypothetical protein